jgi:hypothetical protein
LRGHLDDLLVGATVVRGRLVQEGLHCAQVPPDLGQSGRPVGLKGLQRIPHRVVRTEVERTIGVDRVSGILYTALDIFQLTFQGVQAIGIDGKEDVRHRCPPLVPLSPPVRQKAAKIAALSYA